MYKDMCTITASHTTRNWEGIDSTQVRNDPTEAMEAIFRYFVWALILVVKKILTP